MQKLRPPSFSSHLAVSRAPSALDFLFFGPPPRYALMSPEKGFFAIGAPKMGNDFFSSRVKYKSSTISQKH